MASCGICVFFMRDIFVQEYIYYYFLNYEYMKSYVSLKSLNTFSVGAYANQVVTVYDEYTLLRFWKRNFTKNNPILILGEGSNILFLENYRGTVLLNRIKGIFITESKTEWKLHIGSGEKWNTLVTYTVNNNILGLENLVSIPGYVGSALIHNIGAYGVELSQICEYVDVLELDTGNKIRFKADVCEFTYRGSVFKKDIYKYAVIFVGLKLNKNWKPVLSYLGLEYFNLNHLTAQEIMNIVALIRIKRLPNLIFNGNAGSFFKNPVVDINKMYYLLSKYPNIPYYYQSNGMVKLSAGWLIEHCNLKGYVLGEASVYNKQALILINRRQQATGVEIAALALYVYNKVLDKFNICLQPEVRLIGSYGEISSQMLFGMECVNFKKII